MGRDKALIENDGVRLIDRVHQRLKTVAGPVFFAPGRVGRLGPLPGEEVDDDMQDSGPLGALVAGLDRSPHELLAAVAVDMPWCSAPLLKAAAELWRGEQAMVPVDEGGPQVLHALYSRAAIEPCRVALIEGRLGLRALVRELEVRYIDESVWRQADPTGRFAANLNRPEDLALLVESPE